MTTLKWHQERCIGYDLETTGVNVAADRIVTAAVVHHAPGHRPTTLSWLIDPAVDIPVEASDVHGWTADRIAAALQGREARYTNHKGAHIFMTRGDALESIAGQVAGAMARGTAVIAANAAFDLTLLDAELRRHRLKPLPDRVKGGLAGVVDPMVVEKARDPYRKVKGGCRCGCGATDKTLTGLCLHHKVVLAGAHDAGADALAALRLAIRVVQAWPDVARLRLSTLHEHQVGWRAEQMSSLRAYFDRTGVEHDGCCGEWPLHSACLRTPVGAAS